MYQQKGKAAFNAKLDAIGLLAAHLDNPHKKFKSIHVAGTNGKGSSSHMLASVLQEAGYKVGLYTSPHLKDFRERIRINGVPVSKAFVKDFIAKNKTFFEEHQLSFFEMTVGMAFSFFTQEKVDIAIVEVGLGGRLDATNIVLPEVALITNIGLDHTHILGDSLQKIAREKGGIIKRGIPVVVSETQKETKEVFEAIAKKKKASIFFADTKRYSRIESDLLGSYQHKNSIGVRATLAHLKGFEISQKHLADGLKKVVQNTGLKGRWQILGQKPSIICDTAHNQEGLLLVLEQLRSEKYKILHIVLGFVRDKNLESLLPLFPKSARYYFCKPEISRGLDALLLQSKAAKFELKGRAYTSVNGAYRAAKRSADKEDLIFIGGSTFVVSEVL